MASNAKHVIPQVPIYIGINGYAVDHLRKRGGYSSIRPSMHQELYGNGFGDGWANAAHDYGDSEGDGCGAGWQEYWATRRNK